ncbi:MAG: hypothetical protein V4573_09980 [Pseudomonadota bacterium]
MKSASPLESASKDRAFYTRRHALVWMGLTISVLTAACGQGPVDSPDEEIQQRLTGSWLREYDQEGAHVRRLLVLEADGHFTESARVVDKAGQVTVHSHAGNWLFDGMNLKRHYTSFDGKKPSSPVLPYATFQVRFESSREFVGTDNLRRREVRYQRVEDGAAI